MEKITIENFGPINYCEVPMTDFMLFIGEQASGKSTIAKCIYYCKILRDKLKELLIESIQTRKVDKLYTKFSKLIRAEFLNFFGTTLHLEQFKIRYDYGNGAFVEIALTEGNNRYVSHKFSKQLDSAIQKLIYEIKNNCIELERAESIAFLGGQSEKMLFESLQINISQSVSNKVNEIFGDTRHYLFIPAGRSIITTLSESLELIYKNMEFIEPLTYDFIREMIRFKRRFKNTEQLLHTKAEIQHNDIPKEYVKYAMEMSQRILKGKYDNDGGQEKIYIEETLKFVKLNYASSGQQETVWIINLLLYYIIYNIECQVFIEEPEAHLFPTAQQCIIQFIASFYNANPRNRVIIPTHSPYVLSEINNLVYASNVKGLSKDAENKVYELVSKYALISSERLNVYSLHDSRVENIVDDDTKLIDFTKLDAPAAQPINDIFNALYDLEGEYSDLELG